MFRGANVKLGNWRQVTVRIDVYKRQAIDAAKAVIDDKEATEEQVKKAHDDLQKALFELRLIPNKDKLEDLIKEAEKMDLSGYTSESVKVFEDALAQAKVVMKDPEADQDAVDAAEGQLRAAVEQLEKADKMCIRDRIRRLLHIKSILNIIQIVYFTCQVNLYQKKFYWNLNM